MLNPQFYKTLCRPIDGSTSTNARLFMKMKSAISPSQNNRFRSLLGYLIDDNAFHVA